MSVVRGCRTWGFVVCWIEGGTEDGGVVQVGACIFVVAGCQVQGGELGGHVEWGEVGGG